MGSSGIHLYSWVVSMNKVHKNLSLLLFCVVTLICLVSTASAAPDDLSSSEKSM